MSWYCDGCGDNFSIHTEQITEVCDMGHEHSYCKKCWEKKGFKEIAAARKTQSGD
jgi:hypothetical protein